jgi:hypothetical protein
MRSFLKDITMTMMIAAVPDAQELESTYADLRADFQRNFLNRCEDTKNCRNGDIPDDGAVAGYDAYFDEGNNMTAFTTNAHFSGLEAELKRRADVINRQKPAKISVWADFVNYSLTIDAYLDGARAALDRGDETAANTLLREAETSMRYSPDVP